MSPLPSPRTRETQTYCQALGSANVTTCFYDFGLSQLGFAERFNRLRHRRGLKIIRMTFVSPSYLNRKYLLYDSNRFYQLFNYVILFMQISSDE